MTPSSPLDRILIGLAMKSKLPLILYACALLALVMLANFRALPAWAMWIYRQPNGDLLAHFGLAAGLTFLAESAAGSRTRSLGPMRVPLGASLALAALALEEFSQAFIPARVFSLIDLGATTLGGIAGWRLAAVL